MTNQDDTARINKLVQIAREIERQVDLDASTDHSIEESKTDQLDALERAELNRFGDGIAFLNQVRNRIARPSQGDSFSVAGDPTKDESLEAGDATLKPQPKLPDRLGRFEIQKVLGQGGFARVFLARDPKLNRLVALKVPKPSALMSAEARARFDREAKAAAVLCHPNIVPVFESGSSGQVHYIASGYCDGLTLGEWFDSQSRQIDPRLAAQLVIQMSDAVQHAHQRGVIHRDLKPGNVLLESDSSDRQGPDKLKAALRITDFGLAKVQDPEDQSITTDGAIVGTPVYMSPEQARGDREIDETTDIYSMGVVLYELLTGKLPHQGENHIATLRAVEQDIPINPRTHRSSVPRDLEAICLKSLSKLKRERYLTAHALGEDLQRWLDGQPVSARKIGQLQRLKRWTRRNPALAAALAFALVSLVTGLIATTWQWRNSLDHLAQIDEQKKRAERHLGRVESNIDDILREVSVTLTEVPGMETLRKKVLNMSMAIQEDLIADEAGHPLVQSRTVQAYLRMAQLHRLLGDSQDAEQKIEQAIQLIDQASPATEYFDELKVAWAELLLERSQLLFDRNRHADSLPELHQALEIVDELEADDYISDVRLLRIRLNRMVGIAFEKSQRFEQAKAAYQRALAVPYDLAGDHADQLDYATASILNSLAILLKRTGQSELASDQYDEAAVILNRLRAQKPHRPDYNYTCAIVEYNQGNLLFAGKEFTDAAPHYESACHAFATLRQLNPSNTYYPILHMNSLGIHAATLARLEKFDEAQERFNQAIEIGQLMPDNVAAQSALIRIYNNLARMQHEDLGKPELAEPTLWANIEICQGAVAKFPDDLDLQKSLGVAYSNLTAINMERGEWELAENIAGDQLATFRTLFQENPRSSDYRNKIVTAFDDLAKIHVNRGQPEKAFETAAEIAALDESALDLAYRSARSFAKIFLELQQLNKAPGNSDTGMSRNELQQQIESARIRALEQLHAAIDAGYDRVDTVRSEDPIWKSFRDLPEFQAIVDLMQ